MEQVEQSAAVEQTQTAETPSVTETSQPQEGVQAAPQDTQEVQKVNRYQRLANENREFRKQIKEHQEKIARYSTPEFEKTQKLAEILNSRPDVAQRFINELFQQKGPAQVEPPIDFNQYDEPTAKFLKGRWEKEMALERELEELKAWKQAQEQERESSAKTTVEKQMAKANDYFDKKLVEKGILQMDKSGNLSGDSAVADVIAKATLAKLAESLEDPRHASPEEIDEALESVLEGVSAYSRITQKNQIKKPGVPATGSKIGTTPQKGPETKAQRIARITSSYL